MRFAEPPGGGRDSGAAPCAAAGRAARAFTRLARRAATTPTAARRTSTSRRSTRPLAGSRRGEHGGLPRLGAGAGSPGITEASPHDLDRAWATTSTLSRATWPRRSSCCCREGIDGPYGLALGPDGYTGVIETTEHGGYPVFDHLGRSSAARSSGRPAFRARSSSACAAVTSFSSRVRISRSATSDTTPTPSSSTWKRASASAW